jgi:hypothetical protein
VSTNPKPRSILDVKREREALKQQQPPPQPPVQQQQQPKPEPPKPAGGKGAGPGKPKAPVLVVSWEPITVKCGHTVQFGLYPDGKDKHREQRRKKQQEKNCPACHDTKQKKEMEEAQERRRLKGPIVPKWKRDAVISLERLPNGSTFGPLTYSAVTMEWKGVLRIPDPTSEAGDWLEFTGKASAVFRLLSLLDSQWREWLAERGNKKTFDD